MSACDGDGLKAVKDRHNKQTTPSKVEEGAQEAELSYTNCQEAMTDYEKHANELMAVYEAAKNGDTDAQVKYLEKAAQIEKIGIAIERMNTPLSPACKEKLIKIQRELSEKIKQ